MSGTVTMEYLGTPHADRRRPAIIVTALVLLLAVIATLLLWWSATVRQDTNERLVDAVATSSQRVVTGEAVVAGTLAYTSPMIWSSSVSEEVRRGLRQVLQDSAARVADDLSSVRESAASVTVLPWQTAQAQARDRVVELIDAEIARFQRIAEDATAIGEVLSEDRPSTAAAIESLRASGANRVPLR